MELRAREETGLGQDLTPAIPPVAAVLHEAFLSSHCSSCFRLLPSQNPTSLPSCPSCNSSILYCSPACYAADLPRHLSSGECLLLSSSWRHSTTSDHRAALRLLHFLGPDPLLSPLNSPIRIAGLLASDLEGILQEGGENAERIREGAALMARARNGDWERDGVAAVEAVALWVLMTNAVELQLGGGPPVGIAVYGPMFSWFNHSCSPNACYRFELSSSLEPRPLRVFPAGSEHDTAAWSTWFCEESQLSQGLCGYGPRVVVRSIKLIKKGEEVCITYTDLLQPKAARHSDLWSKYQFVCCCERCNASPQKYIDRVLSCDFRDLNSDQDDADEDSEELAELLDQAVDKYLSDGNPQVCCEMVETMLSEGFRDGWFQAEKSIRNKFRLHPLHHLSLGAYITLASAYNVCANVFDNEKVAENFKMCRAVAAYNLLLAGATHHLFISEISLMPNATLFWINAGESLLNVVRNPKWSSAESADKMEYTFDATYSNSIMELGSPMLWHDFEVTSARFFNCILDALQRSWTFLVEGLPFLENIRNPADFSWLGLPVLPHQIFSRGEDGAESSDSICSECQFKKGNMEQERMDLFHVAALCLVYGKYLAFICYGSECYLSEHASRQFKAI